MNYFNDGEPKVYCYLESCSSKKWKNISDNWVYMQRAYQLEIRQIACISINIEPSGEQEKHIFDFHFEWSLQRRPKLTWHLHILNVKDYYYYYHLF